MGGNFYLHGSVLDIRTAEVSSPVHVKSCVPGSVLREQPLFRPRADLFQKPNNLCFIKWINQVPQECSSESFRIFLQEEQETFAREIEINRELEKKGMANC